MHGYLLSELSRRSRLAKRTVLQWAQDPLSLSLRSREALYRAGETLGLEESARAQLPQFIGARGRAVELAGILRHVRKIERSACKDALKEIEYARRLGRHVP